MPYIPNYCRKKETIVTLQRNSKLQKIENMKRSIIIAAMAALANINASAQTETKNDSVDYNLNLGEVVVKSTAPKTKMKNGAMVTRIEGSVLESAGTAEEMLARVPGMMRMGGQIQVIGKGTPIYYIN